MLHTISTWYCTRHNTCLIVCGSPLETCHSSGHNQWLTTPCFDPSSLMPDVVTPAMGMRTMQTHACNTNWGEHIHTYVHRQDGVIRTYMHCTQCGASVVNDSNHWALRHLTRSIKVIRGQGDTNSFEATSDCLPGHQTN